MTRFTGNNVEEAIQAGLESLKIARSQTQITVLSKGKKGFLGFGKRLAEVEIVELNSQPAVEANLVETARQPVNLDVREADEQPTLSEESVTNESEVASSQEPENVAEETSETSLSEEAPSYNIEEAAQAVLAYLDKIVYEMDIEAKMTAQTSRRQITLQIETPEAGRLIGYHGKVLKSLQLVGQNFLHDYCSKKFALSLNVNDYLEYRTDKLIEVATKIGHRVQDTGKTYRMEPMTNSERKIVHKTIAKISGVESYSEGEDPNRYVVVVSSDNY